jgi:hypothetical protein
VAQQTVDSAEIKRLQLFFGEASRVGLQQALARRPLAPHRRFDLDRRVLHAAQRNGWKKESLDENKTSLR